MNVDVSPAQTRVFLALIAEHAEQGRATVRSVALRSGRSVVATHANLCELRRAGLVTWDTDHQGTLRPLVRPVPASRTGVRCDETGACYQHPPASEPNPFPRKESTCG